MKNINVLVEQFEEIITEDKGADTKQLLLDIYAELIEEGFTADELKVNTEVADILLIDFKHRFVEEDTVNLLSTALANIAIFDSLGIDLGREITVDEPEIEEGETEILPDIKYTLSVIEFDLDDLTKTTGTVDYIFDSIADINDYIEKLAQEVYRRKVLLEGYSPDIDCGIFPTEDMEGATEKIKEFGALGDLILAEKHAGAVAMTLIMVLDPAQETTEFVQMFQVRELKKYTPDLITAE
ncbi:MAG: hypothetical protein ABF633_03415 [Clostridium sp.]|uniref:hypothetical protein n=1 Tax=Clostridium sp. TaxID=1506 RepID=UPI0039E77A1A